MRCQDCAWNSDKYRTDHMIVKNIFIFKCINLNTNLILMLQKEIGRWQYVVS